MDFLKKHDIKTEKLNIKKKRWKLKICLFVILIVAIWEGVTALAKPTLIALCKVKSQSLATSIAGKTVQEVMSGLRVFGFGDTG